MKPKDTLPRFLLNDLMYNVYDYWPYNCAIQIDR